MRIDNPSDGIVATALAMAEQQAQPVTEASFDMRVVADAIVAVAKGMGLSASEPSPDSYMSSTPKGYVVTVRGKEGPTGQPDIEFEFIVPENGSVAAQVYRGAEGGNYDGVMGLMHDIIYEVYKRTNVLLIHTTPADVRLDMIGKAQVEKTGQEQARP